MNQNKNVTFANLSPGKYTFKVKSTNSSGIWQDNEQSLRIIITPPFWATGWAFLVYALIIVICIVLFYNYKKTKLEEKHRINQDLFESKKEKELYDAKIQFFTFITHEIRTPLTLIKAPLEKIIKSNDGNPSTQGESANHRKKYATVIESEQPVTRFPENGKPWIQTELRKYGHPPLASYNPTTFPPCYGA